MLKILKLFSFWQLKFELLDQLKPKMANENVLKTDKLTLQFCGKNVQPPKADGNLLPILMHSCPEDFSTLDYFNVRPFCFNLEDYCNDLLTDLEH